MKATYLLVLILIIACSTKTEVDDNTVVQSLTYSPNSVTLIEGQSSGSSDPIVDDGGSSITSYALTETIAGITINTNTGVINSTANLAVGSYSLSVIATNAEGSAQFNDVYTISVVAAVTEPVSVTYNPNSFTMFSTTSRSSVAPTTNDGGSDIKSYVIISQEIDGITISSSTGVITASDQTAIGTYTISVRAINAIGSTDFTDAFTITVEDIANAVTFTNDIKPLVEIKCTPCHVDGGTKPNWTVYETAKANASLIVTRTANGSMPLNGANGGLSQEQKDLFAQWLADGTLE